VFSAWASANNLDEDHLTAPQFTCPLPPPFFMFFP
jgi:hypothetical protein